MLTDHELLRYSRQILLDDIGIEGQMRLKKGHVVVIGCGGLGMVALPLLAGVGVGTLTIVDFDTVDLTNLHRQTAYNMDDIGKSKVVQTQEKLQHLNPNITIHALNTEIDLATLKVLCTKADCILDCTDNFKVRKAINEAAFQAKTPLISGSAVRFEGQLSVYDFRDELSPCYACLFDGEEAIDGECALFGVFPPVVQIIGITQAQEALKLLLNIGELATKELRIYEALTGKWRHYRYQKNHACLVCGTDAVTEKT